MSRYISRSERDRTLATVLSELGRRSGIGGPTAGDYDDEYDDEYDDYYGGGAIVTGINPNCPTHGYGSGRSHGGYAYASSGGYGRGDQVLQQASATANYVGNTMKIENLNVNFDGNQHVEGGGGKSKGDGRGEFGSYASRGAGGGSSRRERSSSRYGSSSGRSESVGGDGPSGMRGGMNSTGSGGYSSTSGRGYSDAYGEGYREGGSKSGTSGSRSRSGFGEALGGAGSHYSSGSTSGSGGAYGTERVYMHERHFRIGGGGKGESGKSGLREMFSAGGGLSRRSGRSNLKGGDYDGYGGGRGMSSGSTYGGSSMGYEADPPLMLEESRGRSGSILFSRSGSKAGSSAGPHLLDYGYDPQPSRSRSKAGSDIGSAFSGGSSKARSMFGGGGYSGSRELVPYGLPNPPSTGSRRGSQYDADMSGFSRAEGYAKDYYAPPSNTGSRGSSHRSSSHSPTIYPESSVSGTSSSSTLRGFPSRAPSLSSYASSSGYSDSTARGRSSHTGTSASRDKSRSRSRSLAGSMRYLSMHGGKGSSAGGSTSSRTEPRVAALEALQRGRGSRAPSRPPLSRGMLKANESVGSRVSSRLSRSSSVSRGSSGGGSVGCDSRGATYRRV